MKKVESAMCIFESVALRNAVGEENLWCIDTVLLVNHALMEAEHLDYDDVYQCLALRLIYAVAGFEPEKGGLQQHIFAQLQQELLNCKGSCQKFGIAEAPWDLRDAAISWDCLLECASD